MRYTPYLFVTGDRSKLMPAMGGFKVTK